MGHKGSRLVDILNVKEGECLMILIPLFQLRYRKASDEFCW